MAECQACGTEMYGDKCRKCGWDRTKADEEQAEAARTARARKWAKLVKRQEEAKRDLWRLGAKARQHGWPDSKLARLVRGSKEKHPVCTFCAAGKVVVEKYDPSLAESAKRRQWDPVARPTTSLVVLCDRPEPGTGQKCRMGQLLNEAQPKGSFEYGGDWAMLSEALAKGWRLPRMEKADGTVRRPPPDDDLSAFDDLEIPL